MASKKKLYCAFDRRYADKLFVALWNSSSSLNKVANQLCLPISVVRSRACELRKDGKRLKRMKPITMHKRDWVAIMLRFGFRTGIEV